MMYVCTEPFFKVDLIIWRHDMRPATLSINATVVSPTLPYAIDATLKDAIFNAAAEKKNANHLQGCTERARGFLPIVFTVHGGIGPPIAKQWLDSIFIASAVRERMMDGLGMKTARRKETLFQALHACSTIGTDMMLSYCLRFSPGAPSANTHGPAALPAQQLPASLSDDN